ncbi:RNA-binding protein [Candidatus Microgenomates bacterium]|nr:MAG: RNA-binding protein [Candidatus Microgenomates bacterium]
MTNKLFVAGLPYSITDSQLEEYFSKIGNVISAKIITDKYTGQSKGFGFVEMDTPEMAEKAMKELDGTNFEGRTIIVKEAKPQENRGNFNRNNNSRNDNYSKNRW